MSLLWNRGTAVTYGPRELAGPAISFNRIRVTGLRVAFEVEKTSEVNANTAKVSIYNLSADNWSILQTCPDPFVILEVGYEDNLDELFHGDIKKMQYTRQGPDTITTIEAGDGSLVLERARLDKSYKEGFSLKLAAQEALQSIRDAGGVVIDKAVKYLKSGSVPDTKAQTGLCLSGRALDILDKLTGALTLEWSIQDNEVQIIPQNGYTAEEAIVLTPSTGLVGSPIRREAGLEFTALIQTRIKPGRLVKIESRDITGEFRVKKAKFTGDTHDNAWYVTAEAMAV
jgi:hypothetical protein